MLLFITNIELQIKLPSLKVLSFYAVKRNNNPEELENDIFKLIEEEEEGKKLVFGK
jgi:hypothetical protein